MKLDQESTAKITDNDLTAFRRQCIEKINNDTRFFIGLRYGEYLRLVDEELVKRGVELEDIPCTSRFYKRDKED